MTVQAGTRVAKGSRRLPATVVALSAVLGILAIGGVQGGVAMVVDPFEPLGMPAAWLASTPVDTYFWPGVFLLAIAGASLLTVAGLLTRWSWPWASGIERSLGHRWPWLGAIATGATIGAFEVVELFLVPFHPVMHPLLIAMSIAIVALACSPSAREHLRVDSSEQPR